jgi:hypothetical protein
MCDGFLKKKNQGGCPDCPFYPDITLKGNAQTFVVNLREKKWQILTRLPGRTSDAPGSGFESFCRSFFLLLKERKRITVKFFNFLFLNQVLKIKI